MATIKRNVDQACRDVYDVIIIGGGIYGSMLLLEASKAGLKAILLEKNDFGSETSFNSNRIVHGGLRYLQSLNLSRLHESVTERRWFLKNFPDLVRPLPCMMPLYRNPTKNRLTLRAALLVNDWLTRNRNDGIPPDFHIPDGQIIGPAETKRRFPMVRAEGLRGAALWFDAVVPDSNRLLMEVLRWSASAGSTALNYFGVTELLRSNGEVRGVVANDAVAGSDYEIEAPVVVNAAGPQCRVVAQQYATDDAALFRPSVAWNLMLNRPPLADSAVAIQAPTGNTRMYFAHSLGGRLLVGTGHAPVDGDKVPHISKNDVSAMLADLNRAAPGIDLQPADICHIFWGQLPAKRFGSVDLASEPVFLDHGRDGGPDGFFSVSGVKFTTARDVASRTVSLFSRRVKISADRGLPDRPPPAAYQLHPLNCNDRGERIRRAKDLVEHEAPQSLVDLVIRRSNLVGDTDAAMSIASDCCTAFGWGSEQSDAQTQELSAFLEQESTC